MNRDKRESDYPAELESQFILRLPEEPAKTLKEILKCGDNLKNRLTIQVDNDMRHGEVKFDHWLMHAKIVDLPTIVESLKTIDNKSFYKAADICQMMICKHEPDQPPAEEETPTKSKKKDPHKVDKKFLWPHGITPPTKNVRKRRFRKTLKKKYVEAPEIEKEVKRLLRADNEAIDVSWEIVQEDDNQHLKSEPITPKTQKAEKKQKQERVTKRGSITDAKNPKASNVVDIFGGAVSDSDLEDDNITVEIEDSHLSAYDSRLSDTNSMYGLGDPQNKRDTLPIEFGSHMFQSSHSMQNPKGFSGQRRPVTSTVTTLSKSGGLSSDDDGDDQSQESKDSMTIRIEQLRTELEELKQRKKRTQHEITGMENLALRQRFQDILHTLNQDIMFKEMEYQGLLTLQNSDEI